VKRSGVVPLVLLLLTTLVFAGCFGSPRYVAKAAPFDAAARRIVDEFETAVNSRDAEAICGLYAYPSGRCRAVWRQRLAGIPTPINISHGTLREGCAGDTADAYSFDRAIGARCGQAHRRQR